MPLPIPRLDDHTYAELVEEAVAQIPSLAPEWTNHNPSDPGITLVELLAWRVEMLLFRADQVPPAHVHAFLRLLNGPDWKPREGVPLDAEVRETVLGLRRLTRAVTAADWEALALGEFGAWYAVQAAEAAMRGQLLPPVPPVARAHCFPRRDLSLSAGEERPGHVSLVVVAGDSQQPPAPADEERLCQALHAFLDERRLLGTWHHVVPPERVPVRVRVVAALRGDIPEMAPPSPDEPGGGEHERLWPHLPRDPREVVREAVAAFLHPARGGKDGAGWPLGQSVFLSDLYALVERLDLVDHVPLVVLESGCGAEDEGCLAAPLVFNDDGQRISLRLEGHQLPELRMEPGDVHLHAGLIPVTVTVRLAQPRSDYTGAQLGALRATAWSAFPPLHGPPAGGGGTLEVRAADIRRAMLRASGLGEDQIRGVELLAAPSRLLMGRDGRPAAVRFRPGEAAEVDVDLIQETP